MAAVSFFAINRYHFPGMEHAVVLPMLKRMIYPELYPGDLLVDQYIYLYSLFWPAIALFIRLIPIDLSILFAFLYSISLISLFYAVFSLSRTLFSDTRIASLACLILLLNRTFLGGDFFFDQVLDTNGFARVLALLALQALFVQRYCYCGLLIGASFTLHPLTGTYTGGMVLCALLCTIRAGYLRSLLTWLLCAFITAVPILLWRVLAYPDQPAPGSYSTWLTLLRIRSPDHIAPDLWGWHVYVNFGTCFVFVLTCCVYMLGDIRRKFMLGLLGGMLLLVAIGIGTIFLPVPPLLIQLQLCRSSCLLAPLTAIFLSALIVYSLFQPRAFWQRLLVLLSVAPLLYSPGAGSWIFIAVALGIFYVLWFWYLSNSTPRISGNAWQISVVSLALCLGIGAMYLRGSFSFNPRVELEWLTVQKWAQKNTPEDALFIIPPEQRGFRIFSERSVYGTWYDGLILFFNPTAGEEWFQRMKQLGYRTGMHIDEFALAYNKIQPERFLSGLDLKQKHSAVYVIKAEAEPNSKASTQPVYVSNSGLYQVYKLH